MILLIMGFKSLALLSNSAQAKNPLPWLGTGRCMSIEWAELLGGTSKSAWSHRAKYWGTRARCLSHTSLLFVYIFFNQQLYHTGHHISYTDPTRSCKVLLCLNNVRHKLMYDTYWLCDSSVFEIVSSTSAPVAVVGKVAAQDAGLSEEKRLTKWV